MIVVDGASLMMGGFVRMAGVSLGGLLSKRRWRVQSGGTFSLRYFPLHKLVFIGKRLLDAIMNINFVDVFR
jgi:hypothetical protein